MAKDFKISPYVYAGIRESDRPAISKEQKRGRITPEQVLEIVSKNCGVTIEQIISKTRKREPVDARHIYCAIMKKEFDYSLKSIGLTLSNRDHTTVIHSVETFDDRYETEEGYQQLVHKIISDIQMKF